MADRVRGITVEINGDTSKLSDSLRSVNKTLADTQKDLRDVNKALKLDPKNVELLKQKQAILNTAIAETGKKLDVLKQAQEQAAQEMENGSEEAKRNYELLTREIAEAQASMQKLQTQAEATNKRLKEADPSAIDKIKRGINDAGDAAIKAGDKIANIGEKATIASGAVLALGAAAVAAFEEVDAGTDIIIKRTGATGEAAEELNKVYEDIAGSMAVSFDEVGNAIGEINTRFGATGDELDDLTREFLKYSQITNQDVTGAVAGVDKAMKTFNVDSSQTKSVLGLLAKTSQNTGISISTLEGLLQSNGAALMEMGLGLGESVQLMGALEQSGADASTVMASLKKAAVEYQKAGADMGEGLQDLIEHLQNSSTESEATAEAYEIFGSRAGLAFVSLAKQGKINLGDLSGDFEDYAGVVNDTYEATLDGADQLQVVANKTKIALGKLGAEISDGLGPILEDLNVVIEDLTNWFGTLSKEEKTQIVRIGGIVAAAGPAVTIGGKLISTIGSIAKGVASIANPLTISLGLVTALGVAVGAGVDQIHEAQLAEYGWDEAAKELGRSIDAQNEKLQERVRINQETAATVQDERERVQFLWDDLQKIADENGHIKSGYEEQARVLADQINKELGTSLEIINGEIKGYAEVAGAIDALIEKKTVEALLERNRDAWLDAKQEEASVSAKLEEITERRSKAQQELNDLQAKYQQQLEDGMSTVNEYGEYVGASVMSAINYGEIEAAIATAQEAADNIEAEYNKALKNYGQNQKVINDYGKLLAAGVSGDAEVMKKASDDFIATLGANDDELRSFGEDAVRATKDQFYETELAIKAATPGIQRRFSELLDPVQRQLAQTLTQLQTVGSALANGGSAGNISVTNNNTLKLDGKVVANVVNKSLGSYVR